MELAPTESHFSFTNELDIFFLFSFLETEGRQAIAKAQEAVDHLVSFYQVEEISQWGIEPPTFSLRFGYLSTIIK